MSPYSAKYSNCAVCVLSSDSRSSSLQDLKNLLIVYSPPHHPRCSCLSFFNRKEINVLEETFQDFSPYTDLKWCPTTV